MLIKNNNNYYEYLSISIITLIIFYFFIGKKNTGSIAQGDPSNYQLFSRYYFDKYIFFVDF